MKKYIQPLKKERINNKKKTRYLTKVKWTPRPRWTAAQSMQIKIPYVMEAHVGFFASQSKQIFMEKNICQPMSEDNEILYQNNLQKLLKVIWTIINMAYWWRKNAQSWQSSTIPYSQALNECVWRFLAAHSYPQGPSCLATGSFVETWLLQQFVIMTSSHVATLASFSSFTSVSSHPSARCLVNQPSRKSTSIAAKEQAPLLSRGNFLVLLFIFQSEVLISLACGRNHKYSRDNLYYLNCSRGWFMAPCGVLISFCLRL